jgi:DNA-binding transcriptional regulator YiaG
MLVESIGEAIATPATGTIANPIVNVAHIRKKLQMSQTEFSKVYHINIKTLRQWEQGVRSQNLTSLAYLECISKAPEQIRNILNSTASSETTI